MWSAKTVHRPKNLVGVPHKILKPGEKGLEVVKGATLGDYVQREASQRLKARIEAEKERSRLDALHRDAARWCSGGGPSVPRPSSPRSRPLPTKASAMDRQLRVAAKNGDAAEVRRILDAGADVRAADQRGRTALHCASNKGHVGAVKALIASGADPCAKDGAGCTTLHHASAKGHVGAIEPLIAAGANLRAKDDIGGTALHQASWNGNVGAVEALIAAGADLRAKTNAGRTAIHWASYCGHLGVVEALVAAGADLHVKDSEGRTAHDLAVQRGQDAAMELLIRLEAEEKRRGRLVAEAEERHLAAEAALPSRLPCVPLPALAVLAVLAALALIGRYPALARDRLSARPVPSLSPPVRPPCCAAAMCPVSAGLAPAVEEAAEMCYSS